MTKKKTVKISDINKEISDEMKSEKKKPSINKQLLDVKKEINKAESELFESQNKINSTHIEINDNVTKSFQEVNDSINDINMKLSRVLTRLGM